MAIEKLGKPAKQSELKFSDSYVSSLFFCCNVTLCIVFDIRCNSHFTMSNVLAVHSKQRNDSRKKLRDGVDCDGMRMTEFLPRHQEKEIESGERERERGKERETERERKGMEHIF